MSRGRIPLFLDEEVIELKDALRSKGFTVLTRKPGKEYAEMVGQDLPGRILVTRNPRELIYSATLLDFSIIDIADFSEAIHAVAGTIARAWVDLNLKAQHPAFLLVLRQDGRHDLRSDL